MRVLFAGTPQAAVPALNALLESPHEVVAVLTRPDAPAGRGRRLMPSPVAEIALAHGIEVLRPERVRDPAFLDRLAEIDPRGGTDRGLRRADPAQRPGDPGARLGEPALLAAARMARRSPCPARRHGR